MTDRIILTNLRFEAAHGFHEWELETRQPFEVDVELALDLAPAGTTDDLAMTGDYGRVYDVVATVLLTRTFRLLEAIAEAIATDLLAAEPAVEAVIVRVRKPAVILGGPLDHAAVEIVRRPDAPHAG